MATLNLRNPNGYDGQPGTQYHQGIVRFATAIEAAAGTATNVAITPAELTAFSGASFASPPVLGFGSTTPRPVAATTLTSTGTTTLASGAGVAGKLGNATGTLGFFGATGATRVTQGALTNSVTAGGTTGTIANYTDLTTYANDSNAIRNDIYQLSLALANVIGALRSYGLLV
jgi:hypothetical protein